MTSHTENSQTGFRFMPSPWGSILLFLPLPALQPLLQKIVTRAARLHPALFDRLGLYGDKTFLIDPVNMPFVLLLSPAADRPRLRARRRRGGLSHDARIAGTFLTLFALFDGRLDGDALFFTRDLVIEGDTEAIVRLRNALDDMEGRMTDELAQSFGPVAQVALAAMRHIEMKVHP